ncbi:nitrogenase component 1 [Rhodoplanes sp. TEM]|uniref:Nitrogenase component 1 n=1 Tax=Rhodoplanes tepidamans TaxID=200616 RepID=A0ABT5JJW3_RHOTP|nr:MULTISPECIES: nitrogenase component 1 [Rhodoplanes]MDC7789651.1 nitrogenase component 1 [Rhodoplanes tepidamans]MDC7985260.1 nitrogenase component 1 [Rhodoplanes sp. TEM]MDQ0353587.1 hypothetical protein [Rhodoplanes tepidamans]
MSFLLTRLPPFAADYSGVASALHDLGGLVVIHDASGCTGSYTGYDEPRWFAGRASVFCSGLRELDAIMGNDQKLLDNILRTTRERDYGFVAVVASPVPMLVGFDVDGFASLVEHETGLPALGFATTGFGLYDRGLSAAFLAVAKRFVAEPEAPPAGASLLGASPLDDIGPPTLETLRRVLDRAGLPLVSVWGQESGLAAIEGAAGAAVNLVVAASALPLARFMKRRWGIPFVTGLPLDADGEAGLAAALAAAASGDRSPAERTPARGTGPAGGADHRTVVLIGEQIRMTALRAALRRRQDGSTIRVASFFAWDESLAEPGDCRLADEDRAAGWLASADADLVAGDPLLAALLPDPARARFVALPHRAVSARLDHPAGGRCMADPVGAVRAALDDMPGRTGR